jgi:hypothetical protein
MAHYQTNVNFWEMDTVQTLHCFSNDLTNLSFENASQASKSEGTEGTFISSLSFPYISTALLAISVVEIIQRVRNGNRNLIQKPNVDNSNGKLALYVQIIVQLLLAIVFPTAWSIVPFHSCNGHVIWSVVQLILWTTMIFLSFNDHESLQCEEENFGFNWRSWRISVFCLINSAERLWWLYYSQR